MAARRVQANCRKARVELTYGAVMGTAGQYALGTSGALHSFAIF